MTDITAISDRGVARARQPSRISAFLFFLKTNAFRLERALGEFASAPPRLAKTGHLEFSVLRAQSRTRLWSDEHLAERPMQLGKVQNLRIAARLLDGTFIPAGIIFSFWRQLGRPSRARGFVDGRMLQEGCMVPAVGGGLCQLSNALYDVALDAGCEIVERHPHSRVVAGSAAKRGRDATIAWNYVDLRFRHSETLLLRVRLERDELVVELRGNAAGDGGATLEPDALEDVRANAESCGSCEQTACFRHEAPHAPAETKTAYLLDELWPEFAAYVDSQKRACDVLGIPLDGGRWGFDRYRWNTDGFARTESATVATLLRSLASRRLAAQGPARQRAQLRGAEALAKRFATLLTPDVTDVCVAQSLLPFLWRDGHLAARRVTVLMTRLPIDELQRKLDRYAAAHPERATLADFRAPASVVEWERAALAAADRIVTPHSEIAGLFGGRTEKLVWMLPSVPRTSHASGARRIAFPGPTVARKGCYELRDAARALDVEIVPLGSDLENADFWSDVRIAKPATGHWLDGIAAVVQPAIIEHAPRGLLAALAAGVPVIATAASGLDAQPGLTLVPEDDVDALAAAIAARLP